MDTPRSEEEKRMKFEVEVNIKGKEGEVIPVSLEGRRGLRVPRCGETLTVLGPDGFYTARVVESLLPWDATVTPKIRVWIECRGGELDGIPCW
jgi:hypothetical protein